MLGLEGSQDEIGYGPEKIEDNNPLQQGSEKSIQHSKQQLSGRTSRTESGDLLFYIGTIVSRKWDGAQKKASFSTYAGPAGAGALFLSSYHARVCTHHEENRLFSKQGLLDRPESVPYH